MSKKRSAMSANTVIIHGHEIKNLTWMNLSSDPEKFQLALLYEKNGRLDQIARRGTVPMDCLGKGVSEEELANAAILNCFGDIFCKACFKKSNVLVMTQTEIGSICHWCWDGMRPRPEWNPLPTITDHLKKEI